MEIALFGTSADPPTTAHREILRWLAQNYTQVAVWAADNPFKSRQSPLDDRLAMLQILVEELGAENVQVWPQLGDRRSLISLYRAQELWGAAPDYHLVVGSDLIPQIPRWYRVQTLLGAVTLLIFPRSGYALKPAQLQTLQDLGGRYRLVEIQLPAISSSHYRQSQDHSLISPRLQNYIENHHLYSATNLPPF
jgi:nicotinate-nucleotide adenylyltransferase